MMDLTTADVCTLVWLAIAMTAALSAWGIVQAVREHRARRW